MDAVLQTTFSDVFSWMKKYAIWISLKFVPKGAIDNKWALAQVMAWHQTGDKSFSDQMLT